MNFQLNSVENYASAVRVAAMKRRMGGDFVVIGRPKYRGGWMYFAVLRGGLVWHNEMRRRALLTTKYPS